MKDVSFEKRLAFGWTLCRYWPAEVILKQPNRNRSIYIKAPWYRWADQKRWENRDGVFVLEADAAPKNNAGYRLITIRDWPEARRYTKTFCYTTCYGRKQKATLTAYRERTRSVYWALRFFPWAGRDCDDLIIEFDREMGSEAGSWKGGCIGTSCSMQPGESVYDAIDRFLMHAQITYRWDR